MSDDSKTLANAQPGGRVRLGDQAERARFEAWAEDRELDTAKCSADGMKGDYADLNTDWCWAAWQAALSAQPSPGGQDALAEAARRVISDIDSGDYHGEISEATYAALKAALAARQPVGEPVDDDWHLRGYAYASKQATTCAGCGKHKHTPLRVDAMGGHVCLTCIDHKLGALLGEFGYPLAQQSAQVYLDGLDRALGETIDQRDRYHEVADELATRIATITGVDIGEHSSANCPWQNAIEAAEEYKPAQVVDLGQFRDSVVQAISNVSYMTGYGPAYVKLTELLALIDSMAVGNG